MQDEPSEARFDRQRIADATLGTVMTLFGIVIGGAGATPVIESFGNQDVGIVWVIVGGFVGVGGVGLLVFGMMHVLLAYHGRPDGDGV